MHGNSPTPAFLLDISALQVGGDLGCRGCRAEWALNEAPGEQGGFFEMYLSWRVPSV